MGKAFERVVDAFHNAGLKVKESGQGKAEAQAPGHSNADRSVSITDIGGRVLVWSHSDSTDQVLSSLGLTMADLFDDPKGITYEYGDGRRVSRTPFKKFSQSGNTKGNTLYRVEKLAAADVIAFVEGEQDVHAMESLGAVATCTAMGAGKAHLFDLTPLYGKMVNIIRDMDEPGLAHATQVAAFLEGKATVHLLEPAEGKDAADHVASGHAITEFRVVSFPAPVEPVDQEFEQAVESERRFLRVKSEARRRDDLEAGLLTSDTLKPERLGDILGRDVRYDWLIPDLIERQDRVIVTGFEGLGKSYFLRQIAIAVAAGVDPFDLTRRFQPGHVLVIDAENTEAQWARGASYTTHLLEHAGTGNPRHDVIVSAGARLDLTRRADVNQVHKLIDTHKPDVLYIGPLYKLVSKAINSDDDAAPLIVALDSFRERGVTLLMEAHAGHARGLAGERDLRPRGSSALLGWPEFGIGLAPVEGDSDWVNLRHWRGARGGKRSWPEILRHGLQGELPWVPATSGGF